MPAFPLANRPQSAARYDVIGEYSDSSDKFVKHVALLDADEATIRNHQNVPVVHMGPPLERSLEVKANAVGSVPLTNDERKEIAAWIAEIEDEYDHAGIGREKWEQYVIHPPWEDVLDSNRTIRRYRKYSCAGFVICAYGEVEIHLLSTNDADLPAIDFNTLQSGYQINRDRLDRLERFGVDGPGPWHIVLAGYVIHALNRSDHEIRQGPYVAQPGDERFG